MPGALIALNPWQQFGLIGILVGVISGILFMVVKWVLDTNREVLKQSALEREAWTKTIQDSTAQAHVFYAGVSESHKFQRKEHEKMIENLEEQGKVLARINGYHAK